jgi:hypothetical protein
MANDLFRIKVQTNYPGTGGPGLNTWHVKMTDPGNMPLFTAALKTFYQAAGSFLISGGSWALQADGIRDPYGLPTHFGITPWTVAGTSTGSMLPPQTCVVIGWRANSASRSGLGRTFLGPAGSSILQADGTPVDGFLDGLRTAAQNFLSAANGSAGHEVILYSKKLGLAQHIDSSAIKDKFAVLRSRRG